MYKMTRYMFQTIRIRNRIKTEGIDKHILSSFEPWMHCNMASYTHHEIEFIYLIYGMANCNGRKALPMYRNKYPERMVPGCSFFVTASTII